MQVSPLVWLQPREKGAPFGFAVLYNSVPRVLLIEIFSIVPVKSNKAILGSEPPKYSDARGRLKAAEGPYFGFHWMDARKHHVCRLGMGMLAYGQV